MQSVVKNTLSILIMFIMCAALFPAYTGNGAEPENGLIIQLDDRCVTVSGNTAAPNRGVTIDVYRPGCSVEDLTVLGDKLSALAYHDQTVSGKTGGFSFVFVIPRETGTYTVRCNAGGQLQTDTFVFNEYDQYIFNEDFENFTGGMPKDWNGSGDAALVPVGGFDAEHGAVLKINDYAGTVRMGRKLSTSLTQGMWHLSFDFGAYGNFQDFYVGVYDEKNSLHPIVGWNEQGAMGAFDGSSFSDFGFAEKSYTAGKFQKIHVYISMEQQEYFVYCDNEFIAQKDFTAGLGEIKRIEFVRRQSTSDGTVLLDHLRFAQVNEAYLNFLLYNGAPVPIAASLSTDQPGNNFFGNEAAVFSLNLGNALGQAVSAQIDYKVKKADTGDCVRTSEQAVALEGDEQKTIAFDMAGLPFGLYEMEIDIISAEAGIHRQLTMPFAVINRPSGNIKNKRAGVNFPQLAAGNYSAQEIDTSFSMIEKAGFGSVRSTFYWHVYEKMKNIYQLPDGVDAFLNLCNEKGIDMMGVLGFDNYPLYPKLKADDGGNSLNQEGLDGFKAYVNQILGEIGSNCKYLEIWNEPDLWGNEWQYAQLAQETYPLIKEKLPEAVIGGVVVCSPGRWWWVNDVLNNAGAYPYMDAVSIHNYATPPENRITAGEGYDQDGIAKILQSMQTADNARAALSPPKPSLKFWSTEFGWSTGPAGETGIVNEQTQAEYVAREFLFNEAFNHFELSIAHVLLDLNKTETEYANAQGTPKEEFFGMLRAVDSQVPFAAKPAFLSACNYNAMTADAQMIDSVQDNLVFKSVYQKENGSLLHVLWTKGEDAAYEISGLSDYVNMYDLYGNSELIRTDNGSLSLNVSGSPVYIENIRCAAVFLADGKQAGSFGDLEAAQSVSAKIVIDKTAYPGTNSLLVVLAQYSGNTLADIQTEEIKFSDYSTDIFSLEMPIHLINGADTVKLLRLHDFIDLSPLNNEIVIKNKKEG